MESQQLYKEHAIRETAAVLFQEPDVVDPNKENNLFCCAVLKLLSCNFNSPDPTFDCDKN